ncbi:MAG: helix-turn-helix domain-containing protein [Phormidesmis sp. CAN_BIN44]|nr:helix-turn-helix domain-containing protein [Phormidesmis sp. CAN_BIN44]
MNRHLDHTPQLQTLMRSGGVSTFKELSQKAGISEQQIRRLRRGQIGQMRLETLQKLSQALQVTIADLLKTFSETQEGTLQPSASLQHEYQRLQSQLSQQRDDLWQEFQQTSLQTLEPWLLQWSAAAYAAQQNPQLTAIKLLPLVRPIEQLIQQWGIAAIGTVGSEIPYDPQFHQLMSGNAEPGELVKVRYVGYQQPDRDRLLYRVKVSPLA